MSGPYDDDLETPQRKRTAWPITIVGGSVILILFLSLVFVQYLNTSTVLQMSTKTETQVLQFCREDADISGAAQRAVADGWVYVGPLTPNGINCWIGLWTRPVRPAP